MSLPMRGEWIEIGLRLTMAGNVRWSLPMRGEWIEILCYQWGVWVTASLPMRGEWIEMQYGSGNTV